MLSDTVNAGPAITVEGNTVAETLADLFARTPGLRQHILDESGAIRPHVSVFVDGSQAELSTAVPSGVEVRILHAVSGGASAQTM
jgi:molybdopterin converting factor small subunit